MGKHHYVVAHKLIPSIFFKKPQGFIDMNIEFPQEIKKLWLEVGKKLGTDSEDVLGLDVISLKDHGINGIIFIFPETKVVPECIFSACLIEQKQRFILFKSNVPRYITYEFGFNINQSERSDRSVLCEWNKSGMHINYGAGKGFLLDDFIDDLKKRIISGTAM